MSDMTSGFNIAKNPYFKPQFNDLCGFTEDEVLTSLQQLVEQQSLPQDKMDEALSMVKTFYNGYCFSETGGLPVYNPTLMLYFLDQFQETGRYPRNLLDSNLAMDRGKIEYVSTLQNGEKIISHVLNEQHPLVIQKLADRFGIKEILYAGKDTTFMVSLLYYFGVLTLSAERTIYEELIFRIPNLVIRKLYVERIKEMMLPTGSDLDNAQEVAQQLYQRGIIQPLCNFIEERLLSVFDNRDYRWANELTVKTLFLTLLFNDTFYIMDSEPALKCEYADLLMLRRPDVRHSALLDVLIEFKYVPLSQCQCTGEQLRSMSLENLNALDLVKTAFSEAETQLTRYRQTLQGLYGNALRLHTYTVVAIGFERLLWKDS